MNTARTSRPEPSLTRYGKDASPHDIDTRITEFIAQYRFTLALDHASRYRAYALRHQVFREEMHYRLGDAAEPTFERDAYDAEALLCLLTHRDSGLDVGCLRVVLGADSDGEPRRLPLEESCAHGLSHPTLHPAAFARSEVCEVSRLAVHRHFRRTPGSEVPASPQGGEALPVPSPLVSLSLFLAATALVGLAGRRHVFAMMEPRFARLLQLAGLRFQQAGEIIDYCGPRAAYYIDQQQAERDMKANLTPLYRHIQAVLVSQQTQTLPVVDATSPGTTG
ncbi:PEP-CTERM/exosortase system-associated acyltransferase [Halomonas sp. E14]|uniref:PEP-CTERM/exosortase system-associated acyltransferase n=1 Tax=Halomonas sp. E14 TaxID=3397245 RepID=UPI00403E6B7B